MLLRRQEGANLLIVGEDESMGQGALFSALAAAVVGHGRTLEAWVLDFMPFDSGLDGGTDGATDGGMGVGFGSSVQALAARAELHVGRRRYLAKYLDQVHRLVQDRLVDGEVDGPTRLLVVSGLGRARDFDPRANRTGIDGLDPVEVLAAILRDGPEVGIHTLVWCDSVDLLHRRLGPDALREFGVRVGAAMDDDAVDHAARHDRRGPAQAAPGAAPRREPGSAGEVPPLRAAGSGLGAAAVERAQLGRDGGQPVDHLGRLRQLDPAPEPGQLAGQRLDVGSADLDLDPAVGSRRARCARGCRTSSA